MTRYNRLGTTCLAAMNVLDKTVIVARAMPESDACAKVRTTDDIRDEVIISPDLF